MEITPQKINLLPHNPGVYIYRNTEREILYVGKAIDLYKRVHQYFVDADDLGPKTRNLVSQIATITTKQTSSEFEALLLEAALIHKYLPKYNILAKDDKSPLYIRFTTDEQLPHIEFVRRTTIDLPTEMQRHIPTFGPFGSGKALRAMMRDVRFIIPYCTQKERNGKPCFYTHLGLCSNCPSIITKLPEPEKSSAIKSYRAQIFHIVDLLSGRSKKVSQQLEKQMQAYAKKEEFEHAAVIRNQWTRLGALLQKHYDPSAYMRDEQHLEKSAAEELKTIQSLLLPYYPAIHLPLRIECFDISNTMGQQAVGSMVVLTNGLPDKSQYRRFRIHSKQTPDDFAMMAEMLTRRLKHSEWGTADLIVIDGGKGQLSSVSEVFRATGTVTPFIGLAKQFEDIIIPTDAGYKTLRLPHTNIAIHLLQRIRDEAHRFAITYHRKLRSDAFLP